MEDVAAEVIPITEEKAPEPEKESLDTLRKRCSELFYHLGETDYKIAQFKNAKLAITAELEAVNLKYGQMKAAEAQPNG